jgi:hypothetical protein
MKIRNTEINEVIAVRIIDRVLDGDDLSTAIDSVMTPISRVEISLEDLLGKDDINVL